MLVDIITFEIRDFTTQQFEEFVVENTACAFDFIASHRRTRNIQFSQMFDFEFARKEHSPKFLAVADAFVKAYENHDNLLEIDEIDEMNGTY